MPTPKLNEALKDFSFTATNNLKAKLSDYKDKNVILYFYPKDNTPGCTLEGQNFRDKHKEFEKSNTIIFGISCDDIKSHEKFKSAQCFPFELIMDEDEKLCNLFGVIKVKKLYGKQVRGIERSTFLIDKTGKLQAEWRGVKVDGHVIDVLTAIKSLSK